MAKIILMLLFCLPALAKERIYVVDTGIHWNYSNKSFKCKDGHKNFAFSGYHPHGDQMTRLIIRGLDSNEVCLVDVRFYTPGASGQVNLWSLKKSLKYLLTQKPGIVNMSLNGPVPDREEKELLHKLLSKGFKLSLTAGNEGDDLSIVCNAYPACYFTNRISNVKISSNREKSANKNGPVTNTDHLKGGTSFSTANTTNKWIKHVLNLRGINQTANDFD